MLVVQTVLFGLTLWLGLYLLARERPQAPMVLPGLTLTAFALFAGLDALANYTAAPSTRFLLSGASIALAALTVPLAVAALVALLRRRRPTAWRYASIAGVVLAALGVAALLLVEEVGLRLAILPAASAGLLLLGLAAAVADAAGKGERLLPDLLRSFDYSFFVALFLGGQVAVVMFLATGVTAPMLALLLAIVATSVATQVFLGRVQDALDTIAFARLPWLRAARAELREVADVLPRANPDIDVSSLDDDEFARLTRAALSNYGDLPKLAASPLNYLPAVDARLARRGAKDDALERAIELKAVLTESILRLKPRDKGDFGTSDEWRYYNALYFPYVAGLKPFSRRANGSAGAHNDPAAREALEWFRTYVPERTLYNWQTAAARLVAQDLRGRAE
ncbi:MAG TPA: hypothetical protein VFR15_12465 [Chloroflexia bacterium]|nr:hypothetical protein [Chloroflexia bacterium]